MPVTNDLTPEERAEFEGHGVTFQETAAPAAAPPQEPTPAPAPEPAPAPAPAPEPAPAPAAAAEPAPVAPAPVTPPTTAVPVTPPVGAPAPAPAAPGPTDPAAPPPGFVPHAALHAERVRAAEAIRQSQLATTRLNAILARQQEAPAAPPVMPNLEEDAAGYIQALEARVAAFEGVQTEAAQVRQLEQSLEQDEQLFALAQPDYAQAQDYYIQSRARELLVFYTPQEAQKIMEQEVRQIAQQSWGRSMSAAQNIYTLAQSRGYTPASPAPAPAPAPSPAPAPVSGAPAPAPSAAPAAVSPQAAVAAVAAGQQASSSLSGVGGAAASQTLNAEALLAMTDAEFEKYMALGTKEANSRFAEIGGR